MFGDVVVVQSLCILKGRNQDKVVFEGSHLEVGASQILMAVGRATTGAAGYPCSGALQFNDGSWSVHLIRHFNPDRDRRGFNVSNKLCTHTS